MPRTQTNGVAPGSTIVSPTLSNPTITGTVTASQVTGIPVVLAKWGVPCILASSGTMANNGAVSGMTALPIIYSGGAWLYLPANAIQAGSAAGFYWFVASTTQAGTVYNSMWDGSGIPGVGTTTAFSTTGPGAFTGIATGEITVATIPISAGAIGANGELLIEAEVSNNTAAGNKIFRADLGGTDFFSVTLTTSMGGILSGHIRNRGSAAVQFGVGYIQAGTAAFQSSVLTGTVNTANAQNLTATLEKATATNHAIWDGGTVMVVYGS